MLRRSPPPSAEELAATAAALVGLRAHLQRSPAPAPPPPEIAMFIHRYHRS